MLSASRLGSACAAGSSGTRLGSARIGSVSSRPIAMMAVVSARPAPIAFGQSIGCEGAIRYANQCTQIAPNAAPLNHSAAAEPGRAEEGEGNINNNGARAAPAAISCGFEIGLKLAMQTDLCLAQCEADDWRHKEAASS